MKIKEILFCSAALVGFAAMLCSCGNKKSSVKLPDEEKAARLIGEIIEDRIDTPQLVSETDSEAVWQVDLPDRNDLKVSFTFYKSNPAQGIDGSYFKGDNWEMRSKNDYVSRVIESTDISAKDAVDEKYGMIPGSTEICEKYGRPSVRVHTAMTYEEFTPEKVLAYMEECMKVYDLRIIRSERAGEAREHGTENLQFLFVMDSIIMPDGEPFEYHLALREESLSQAGLEDKDRHEYIDDHWVRTQMEYAKWDLVYAGIIEKEE